MPRISARATPAAKPDRVAPSDVRAAEGIAGEDQRRGFTTPHNAPDARDAAGCSASGVTTETLGEVFRNRRHSGDTTETRFAITLEGAVGQRKANGPRPDDPRCLPRFDQQTKMWVARGEKLRPVVEHAAGGAPRRQASPDPASFVEHHHAGSICLQRAGRDQSAKASANHNDIRV